MTTNQDVCERWVARLTGRTGRKLLETSNVLASESTIYSYGRHFAMAEVLRNRDGSPRLILVNGDRYSVSTTRHQTLLRSALAGCGVPTVTVPFTALSAAGIDAGSVELIEATADRYETTDHVSSVQPDGSVWRREERLGYVDLTDSELVELVERRRVELNRPDYGIGDLNKWDRRRYGVVEVRRVLYTGPRSHVQITVDTDADGRTRYSWSTGRHWLGESTFSARVSWRANRKCAGCNGKGRADGDQCMDCYGRGAHTVTRSRKAVFLSGFDMQEPRPLYFLCELPRGAKVASVADAYQALKPETVVLAEAMGRPVVRQGDIFAVPVGLNRRALTAMGARYEKGGNLHGTNHAATEVAYLPDGRTLARGTMRHTPEGRRPDHIRKTLGKSWHIVVKNTVPVSA